MIINLAMNGMDAMDDCKEGRRKLEIQTQQNAESGMAEVAVSDSGKGIPDQDLRRIFYNETARHRIGFADRAHDHPDLWRNDLGGEPQ